MILGHHVNTSHGFVTSASHGKSNGANIIQIFLNSPQSFNVSKTKNSDLLKLRDSAKKNKVKIVIHGSFLINFCRGSNDYNVKKAKELLISDLNRSVTLQALGVVIHMGKNVKDLKITDKQALKNYIANVKDVLKRSDKKSILILETGAGQGTEIATKINEMGYIRDALSFAEMSRVKFCLDTCHMFSAGYHLGDKRMVEIFEQYIEIMLGWDNVAVIHLNDSKVCYNARIDRHADIGKGYIKLDGLKTFVQICTKRKIPMVLETPADIHNGKKFSCSEQIKLVRGFIKKS